MIAIMKNAKELIKPIKKEIEVLIAKHENLKSVLDRERLRVQEFVHKLLLSNIRTYKEYNVFVNRIDSNLLEIPVPMDKSKYTCEVTVRFDWRDQTARDVGGSMPMSNLIDCPGMVKLWGLRHELGKAVLERASFIVEIEKEFKALYKLECEISQLETDMRQKRDEIRHIENMFEGTVVVFTEFNSYYLDNRETNRENLEGFLKHVMNTRFLKEEVANFFGMKGKNKPEIIESVLDNLHV